LLSFRVVEVENQIKRERETLIKDFEQKIKSAEEHFNLKSLHLELLINKEKQEIKEFVEEQIIAANQELEAILKNLANEQEEKNKLYKEVIETDTKIDLIRGEISSLNKKKEELEANLNNLEKLQTDIKEYSILSKAFDKTGIPILKLENSSVMITSLANELLASFENKFRIAFETTKLTKDKKKMKEVFDINVLDEDGLCELKNKSGGERVWIETSIQLALGILLRCQGKAHQTSFLDEQDGSLDLGNAFCYRAMIEKAHEKSGVHNTIIITHRPELVDLIDQKLVFDDSKIKLVA
jgi:DNA repair exonuclease SbcCD ATPase subunit